MTARALLEVCAELGVTLTQEGDGIRVRGPRAESHRSRAANAAMECLRIIDPMLYRRSPTEIAESAQPFLPISAQVLPERTVAGERWI
jgi:hypothetical protein